MQVVQIFGETKQPASVPVLLQLVTGGRDDGLRMAALTSLQLYDDPTIGEQVLKEYPKFNDDLRSVALTLLVSRKRWALDLLSAANSNRVARDTIPLDFVRRMTAYNDDRIVQLISKLWGSVDGATTADMQQQIERLSKVLKSGGTADPYLGKKLFAQHCGKCHTLFATGGQIGPDLTAYKRDDLDTMLVNVVNPSAEVREGFETLMAVTDDGRTVIGFLVDRDSQVVVLRGADGQTITIPQNRIEEMHPQRKSLMPEALLKGLTDQQVRNLFAYLRSHQPLDSEAP